MGGRGRSRTQRKHFRQNRENVWKRSRHDDSGEKQQDSVTTTNDDNKEQRHWEPFATQNPAFDEYYKVKAEKVVFFGDLGMWLFDYMFCRVMGFE